MLDIQLLRNQIETVVKQLARRGLQFDAAAFLALEEERKALQTRTQALQAQRNTLSRQIGVLKGKGEDASGVMAEVAQLADELKVCEQALPSLLEKIESCVAGLPNLPHESVPEGMDEQANVEVTRWGTPGVFDFEVRDHVDEVGGSVQVQAGQKDRHGVGETEHQCRTNSAKRMPLAEDHRRKGDVAVTGGHVVVEGVPDACPDGEVGAA